MNKDGFPDLIFMTESRLLPLVVLENIPCTSQLCPSTAWNHRYFKKSAFQIYASGTPVSFGLVDTNNDGNLDVMVTSWFQNQLQVFTYLNTHQPV
jgi:hypothetical protein